MSQDDQYRGDPPPVPPAPPSGPHPAYAPGYAPPPGYGQPPGYGPPPGYGSPPGYGPPAGWVPGTQRPPTNTLAILALVFAFVFPPAALVLGLMARKQIRQTGEEGDGLALAAVIIGGIAVALFALMFVVAVVALMAVGSSSVGY